MNVLLDTHTLIWFSISPSRLSEKIINLLSDADNNLFLSIASVWEIQTKYQLGKLNLDLPLPELIETQKQTNGLQILPIELSHIYTLDSLPNHHRDPFDRILIAQAIFEKMPLLSIDGIFDAYPINKIW
ncbi:type II toxin-antitoxin system VapC family toxin [Brunnivagina elsteri]|uniref:PIN domain nuclease n=1 Tax=Brunnivagina elsteri CCALA 953 TaxID=987040 RepID=A0A2A2TB47_9CYAN|nr:type II toxin-antitoxin system VapC family toxin [Calothrix elsteri]PAX49850.1 PIN domain nuclease [Calothrix elsteri CCALA 953]